MTREVSMDEFEHRAEGVDEAINEVIVKPDAGLASVGKAVREVNETLAVHAAWTEERFEAVDDRFASLARVLLMTSGKVEMQIAGIDSRLAGLGVSQSGIGQTSSKMEENQAALLQKVVLLGQSQEALQQGLTMLAAAVQGLTTGVREVLAYAISEEVNQHLTKPAGQAACQ